MLSYRIVACPMPNGAGPGAKSPFVNQSSHHKKERFGLEIKDIVKRAAAGD